MSTAQKMKFSIKDSFSKCDQIRSFLRSWSHLLRKFLMENFIICAVEIEDMIKIDLGLNSVHERVRQQCVIKRGVYVCSEHAIPGGGIMGRVMQPDGLSYIFWDLKR